MNKENIRTLIQAITESRDRFNMTQFFGKISDSEYTFITDHEVSVYELTLNPIAEYNSDQYWDCSSTACIAGFATYLAENGKISDEVRTGNVSKRISYFSNKAAEYMGLPVKQAEKLFYNNWDSIWSRLYEENHPDFRNLETCDDSDCGMCAENEEHDSCEFTELIAMNSITPDNAIDVLTMLVNEKIEL